MSRPSDFLPMGAVTGVGSLLHTDPQAALQLIAQMCPEVPFWPQLPRLDEPCLALLAHGPFQHVAGQVVQMLRDVVATLQAANVLVGIHCCAGQPPFQAMCQAAPNILSFDAYQDLETFCADSSVRRFIHDGGLIACGLVPTFFNLSDLDATTLFTRWLLAWRESRDIRQLASRTLITATCGLGLLSLYQALSTFGHVQCLATPIKKVAQQTL